jgi:hypothetical protein
MLKTYFEGFGQRRLLLAILVLSLGTTSEYLIAQHGQQVAVLTGVPSWGGISAVLVLFAHNARRNQIRNKAYRLRLFELRQTGIWFMEQGNNNIASEESLLEWSRQTEEWANEVYCVLRSHCEADAEWFRRIDSVPVPKQKTVQPISIVHRDLCDRHAFLAQRVGKILYECSREPG